MIIFRKAIKARWDIRRKHQPFCKGFTSASFHQELYAFRSRLLLCLKGEPAYPASKRGLSGKCPDVERQERARPVNRLGTHDPPHQPAAIEVREIVSFRGDGSSTSLLSPGHRHYYGSRRQPCRLGLTTCKRKDRDSPVVPLSVGSLMHNVLFVNSRYGNRDLSISNSLWGLLRIVPCAGKCHPLSYDQDLWFAREKLHRVRFGRKRKWRMVLSIFLICTVGRPLYRVARKDSEGQWLSRSLGRGQTYCSRATEIQPDSRIRLTRRRNSVVGRLLYRET